MNRLFIEFDIQHTTYLITRILYVLHSTVFCQGQDFWGTQVSLYLNFRGTFTNSGGHTKSFKFVPVKLKAVAGDTDPYP